MEILAVFRVSLLDINKIGRGVNCIQLLSLPLVLSPLKLMEVGLGTYFIPVTNEGFTHSQSFSINKIGS